MKNFKFGSIAMLALIAIAVFFTACSKQNDLMTEVIETETSQITNSLLDNKIVVLPAGYEDETAAINFMNAATEAQVQAMVENHRRTIFLIKEGKYGEVVNTLKKDEGLSDVDLTNHLTARQVAQLASFDATTKLDSRYTTCSITSGYCWTKKRCCWVDHNSRYCWIAWQGNFC